MITLKKINETFHIRSGMCIELFISVDIKDRIIIFGTSSDFMNLCYTDYDEKHTWASLTGKSNCKYSRIKIYNSPSVSVIFDEKDLIYDSQDYEIVEYTIDEIAEKLGIKPSQLKIVNNKNEK